MNNRFPKNCAGDFYTTGYISDDGEWCSDCTACGLPEAEAPTLLAELNDNNLDTYFIKQPISDAEIQQAIGATEVCCTNAVRYGGQDKSIIQKIDPSLCDYKVNILGRVVPASKKWWCLW